MPIELNKNYFVGGRRCRNQVATLGGKVIVGGRVVVVAGYVVCGRVVATTTLTAGKWAWNGV
jgi:S-adenosylhomocysteine hydrolase